MDARERARHNRACESACRLEPRSLLQRRQPGACAPICESQNRATLGTHRILALAGSVIGSFASEAMLFPLQLTTDDPPLHPSHGHAVAVSSPHTTQSTVVDAPASGDPYTADAATTASGTLRRAEPRAPPPSATQRPATSQPARSAHAETAAPTRTRRPPSRDRPLACAATTTARSSPPPATRSRGASASPAVRRAASASRASASRPSPPSSPRARAACIAPASSPAVSSATSASHASASHTRASA